MKLRFLNNATICFSIFRVIFGLLMIEQIHSLVPYVYDLQNSHVVLHYPNLDFIDAYSIFLIDILKYTSVIGAVLLALGVIPRIGAFLFLIAFGYLFLIDMSWYNNHYYLWCLMALLFVLVDTNNSISIFDVLNNSYSKKTISITAVQSFKVLITIVYLYAALVKINPDWLQGYPAILWFEARNYPNPKIWGVLMSYIGLFYDLCMPILLWSFSRKILVVVPYLLFHIINSVLFPIGMFPFIMMAALLFYAPNDVTFQKLKIDVKSFSNLQLAKLSLIGLFILFNILFPLRFLMYTGRTSWHHQGYYFSWRMMLDMNKSKDYMFKVVIPSKEINYLVDLNKLMNQRQYANSFKDPYMIWYIAQKLNDDASNLYSVDNTIVNVYNFSKVKLNQHEFKLLLNNTTDLSKVKYTLLSNNNFINN